ncbi:hypothetical protein POSPLADRAFT_1045851 [Postia placenta MAD-698-R-SB12]|uniref:3-oxoacyl-[acyl-carrier-protein] reductase n=1 Tax=Postia placenta MAD-698-R-SB12 TaxID=670580 RepID=A0A1X6N4K6_9APHY|nr:hypothetical protein POSPLADRAFT_1045851 [Postia placenta MAD-698-R-SB12]OSX63535.1 hypothetical protein POSPLADRAFT_1045851 [Postia placenta MAD-698-R-SB12]
MAIVSRVAIVTGAAQGIGLSIALRLADDGLDVAVNDTASKSEQLEDAVSRIRAKGRRAIAVLADVTQETQVEDMVSQVVEQLGSLDVASLLLRDTLLGMVVLNLVGQDYLRIVHLNLPYEVLLKAQEVSAEELAKYKITVNTYAPGIIRSSMAKTLALGLEVRPYRFLLRCFVLRSHQECCMPADLPLAEPEVVAAVVSFLIKPESYFITDGFIVSPAKETSSLVPQQSWLETERGHIRYCEYQSVRSEMLRAHASHPRRSINLIRRGRHCSSYTPCVALVTGAAQGLGLSIALRLADDGFDVAVNDLPPNEEALASVVAQIKAKGRRAVPLLADVTKEEEVRDMVSGAVDLLGGLDVVSTEIGSASTARHPHLMRRAQMVANAGIVFVRPLTENSVEEWDRIMSVNVRGVMLSYKYAALQMIMQGRGGRIIGAASTAGKAGFHGLSAYSSSKFAVRGLTQTLELLPHKITVNAYAPTILRTPMASTLVAGWEAYNIKGGAPAAEPNVVSSLVSYLAKPEAYFITGHTISPNAGALVD